MADETHEQRRRRALALALAEEDAAGAPQTAVQEPPRPTVPAATEAVSVAPAAPPWLRGPGTVLEKRWLTDAAERAKHPNLSGASAKAAWGAMEAEAGRPLTSVSEGYFNDYLDRLVKAKQGGDDSGMGFGTFLGPLTVPGEAARAAIATIGSGEPSLGPEGGYTASFTRSNPEHPVLAGMYGFGLDIATDPTTWFGLGILTAGAAASRTNWARFGKKGMAGPGAARAIQDWQMETHAARVLSGSEGAKMAEAFGKLTNREALEKAIYENRQFGTPIPSALKSSPEAVEALHRLRVSNSIADELRQASGVLDDAVKSEYPSWDPRYFEEPIEEKAAQGRAGRSARPAMERQGLRQDTYAIDARGLSKKEAEDIASMLPRQERPFQPAAPTMSKGMIEGTDYGSTIQFPNTPEGKAGWEKFQKIVDQRGAQDATFADRVRLDPSAPLDMANPKKPLTPITDIPTLQARKYQRVLEDIATDRLLKSLVGMTDEAGKPVTVFVPRKGVGPGQVVHGDAPPGFAFMEDEAGRLTKRWGILNDAEEAGKKGHYAVREDLAEYLKNKHAEVTAMGEFLHDFADTVATNQISGPGTAVMNRLQNAIGIDTLNGTSLVTSTGRRLQKMARGYSKQIVETGIIPRELEPIAGLIQDPVAGLTEVERADILGYEDKIAAIFEKYDTPGSRPGRLFGELVTGSPFAKSKTVTATGGALIGGLEGARENNDNRALGAIEGAAAGAALALGARWSAPKLLGWFRHSDQVSTIAAFLRHKEDFLAKGLSEADAVAAAVEKTRDLTQAGHWGRLGGVGETIGSAPSGMTGDLATERGARKLLLNRYIKWPEVQTRILNAAFTKYGVREKLGAAWTVGALGAAMYGGALAAQGMGLMSADDIKRAKARYPGAILTPVWDFKQGKPVVVALNGRMISGTPLDIADLSGRGLASKAIGPVLQSGIEAVGGEKAQSIFTGAPLRMTETDRGTPEEPWEAFARVNEARYASPYILGGRTVEGVVEGTKSVLRGEANAPTPGELVAAPFVGRIRDVNPEEVTKSLSGQFHAQMNDIEDAYFSARNKAKRTRGGEVDLKVDATSEREQNEKIADLAEEYLGKGLPAEELFRHLRKPPKYVRRRDAAVRRILIERGVLKETVPSAR